MGPAPHSGLLPRGKLNDLAMNIAATVKRSSIGEQLAAWTLLAAHDRAPFKFNGKIDRLKINYLPQCRLTKKRRGHE